MPAFSSSHFDRPVENNLVPDSEWVTYKEPLDSYQAFCAATWALRPHLIPEGEGEPWLYAGPASEGSTVYGGRINFCSVCHVGSLENVCWCCGAAVSDKYLSMPFDYERCTAAMHEVD